MFVSEHTVQDHLKSIFTKTDTRTRRALLARILAGQTARTDDDGDEVTKTG